MRLGSVGGPCAFDVGFNYVVVVVGYDRLRVRECREGSGCYSILFRNVLLFSFF